MKCIGIIPARYGSTRFPGKPLADIGGKTMIRRVYEQAIKCDSLADVIVATDHQLIFDHVRSFGNVVMTSSAHRSGTERCLEAVRFTDRDNSYHEDDVVINIQGDEPFIHPSQIAMVTEAFAVPGVEIASLMKRIGSDAELFNESIVKVIVRKDLTAIYFSRLPIPFLRGAASKKWLTEAVTWYKHIGIYGYRVKALDKIVQMPESNLEKAESLEQLRWIENGMQIHMRETDLGQFSIDTPEDLSEAMKQLL